MAKKRATIPETWGPKAHPVIAGSFCLSQVYFAPRLGLRVRCLMKPAAPTEIESFPSEAEAQAAADELNRSAS